MTDELSGTAWMDADQRPPVAQVDGFAIVDRATRADRPHPMIARNRELVEPRLRQSGHDIFSGILYGRPVGGSVWAHQRAGRSSRR